MVNGNRIGEWSAVRKEHPPKAINSYDCTIHYTSPDGRELDEEFEVTHYFGDTAMILAAKVLLRANELRIERGI